MTYFLSVHDWIPSINKMILYSQILPLSSKILFITGIPIQVYAHIHEHHEVINIKPIKK